MPHFIPSTDGYSTVDRRERRLRGIGSAGEASEKEPLKVSGHVTVGRYPVGLCVWGLLENSLGHAGSGLGPGV